MQIIQPHVRTTKSSWWEIISGAENGLTNLFQKYLRAYYVLGKDLAHRGRVSYTKQKNTLLSWSLQSRGREG